MILTVTLNPLLERRLFFNSIQLGKTNRCSKEIFYAGGKGINVSRQLNYLDVKNSAFTFLGGNNGKVLRHCLVQDKIDFSIVSTKSETRMADLIIEKNQRVSTFFGKNSEITIDEANEMKSKLEKMIQNCSIVVFSGSSASSSTDYIFPFGIEMANKHDKISIVDTYGAHLQNCIDAGPTVIHNNVDEVEKSLGISLESEDEKIQFLNDLYSKKIRLAFLTDGANPFYASKFDFHYKVESPFVNVVDATGSGDAFVAGIVYGLENSLVFDEFIKIAAALGAVNATKLETCGISFDEMNKYIDGVKNFPIGKKMKLIDDTPNY
jgi:1-phosphofructokinase family hexose kinase